MFAGKDRYTFTALTNGATRLESRQDYTFNHWFAKLLTPVIAMAAQEKPLSDLARLKAAAERQP